MGKIIKLTESQIIDIVKNVNGNVIKENSVNDFKDFERQVDLDVNYPSTLADGKEIEDLVAPNTITVKFDLEFYVRRYGVETIMVTNIRGPKEIEIELTFLKEEEDREDNYNDYYEVTHTIPINWNDIELSQDDNTCGDLHTTISSIQIDLDKGLFVDGIFYVPGPEQY